MERMWNMVKVEKGLSSGQKRKVTGYLAEADNHNFLWYQELVDQIGPGLKVFIGEAKEQEI